MKIFSSLKRKRDEKRVLFVHFLLHFVCIGKRKKKELPVILIHHQQFPHPLPPASFSCRVTTDRWTTLNVCVCVCAVHRLTWAFYIKEFAFSRHLLSSIRTHGRRAREDWESGKWNIIQRKREGKGQEKQREREREREKETESRSWYKIESHGLSGEAKYYTKIGLMF